LIGKPSIAVLPFANLGGDPAPDYLTESRRNLRRGVDNTPCRQSRRASENWCAVVPVDGTGISLCSRTT